MKEASHVLAENMVFSLNVMQPTTDAKEALISSQVMLCLGCINKSNSLEKLNTVRFSFKLFGFELANRSPTSRDIGVIGAGRGLCEDAQLAFKILDELLDPFRSLCAAL